MTTIHYKNWNGCSQVIWQSVSILKREKKSVYK
jgi:hypothetical protein